MASSNSDPNRTRQIDNTKTGLLFLIIGALTSWIPLGNILGWIAVLIGAVLMITGRNAFGRDHTRNLILSIIVFTIGLAVYIAIFVVSLYTLLTTRYVVYSSVPETSGVLSLSFVIGSALVGIAAVLFTYALQKTSGRVLLWAGFSLAIVILTVNTLIASPELTGSGGRPVIFEVFTSPLAQIPTAILYASALFQARKRIVTGKIPSQQTTEM